MLYLWHVVSKISRPITSTYSPSVSAVVVLAVVSLVLWYNWKRARMVRMIGKIPGPPALPVVGNTIECNVSHDGK